MEFRERKEGKELRMRRAIENLIEPEEDIELRINRAFDKILSYRAINLSELIPWKRKEIVDMFIPLLYLLQRGKIECAQEEFFKDIYITVVDNGLDLRSEGS
jgi:chromatin segregation and condensation protein Rec8/ScpA/Scc1 (kleisin family)